MRLLMDVGCIWKAVPRVAAADLFARDRGKHADDLRILVAQEVAHFSEIVRREIGAGRG